MPEPARDPEFEKQALEFLMDDDPRFSRSDLQSADELSRIVQHNEGSELKDGQADPAGQVVLELQFGEEGAKRRFVFAGRDRAEAALLMIANDSDPAMKFTDSAVREVP